VKEYALSYMSKAGQGGVYVAPALKKATTALNGSVNSRTGFRADDLLRGDTPPNILKRVRANLSMKKDYGFNSRYAGKLEKGDLVRVDRIAIDPKARALYKKGSYKASHNPVFSKELYKVVWHDATNMVKVEGVDHLVLRGQVVKVQTPDDPETFVREYSGLTEAQRRRFEAFKTQRNTWKERKLADEAVPMEVL
jgi:hypothetical protein